ncbi:MAG: hypothetical protein JSW47_14395 [Phycisphaerales bacterium]|nr:MAG: hypothetical protein JSW47_14395 [Phycisphaerales bacterium]
MLTKDQVCRPVVIIPALVVVYFLVFPADLEVLIAPLTEVLTPAGAALSRIFGFSSDVSPWLYILASVFILSRTVTRIWGHKS